MNRWLSCPRHTAGQKGGIAPQEAAVLVAHGWRRFCRFAFFEIAKLLEFRHRTRLFMGSEGVICPAMARIITPSLSLVS
jgi:hypothetical protein